MLFILIIQHFFLGFRRGLALFRVLKKNTFFMNAAKRVFKPRALTKCSQFSAFPVSAKSTTFRAGLRQIFFCLQLIIMNCTISRSYFIIISINSRPSACLKSSWLLRSCKEAHRQLNRFCTISSSSKISGSVFLYCCNIRVVCQIIPQVQPAASQCHQPFRKLPDSPLNSATGLLIFHCSICTIVWVSVRTICLYSLLSVNCGRCRRVKSTSRMGVLLTMVSQTEGINSVRFSIIPSALWMPWASSSCSSSRDFSCCTTKGRSSCWICRGWVVTTSCATTDQRFNELQALFRLLEDVRFGQLVQQPQHVDHNVGILVCQQSQERRYSI